jgi:nucleoside 2-deoxyribosyltransferase
MLSQKPRVFVSFDFDNDKILKDFIAGQSKLSDSPFEISDWSMKEAAPQANWEAEARARISRSDMVIVMVGPKTDKAPGVLKEVKIARALKKPIYQIIGYKNGNYTPVPDAGRLYSWNWDNLKKLFQ